MLLNYSSSKSFPLIILLPLLYRKKLRAREYMHVICSRSSSLETAEEELKFCSALKLQAFSIRREMMRVNSKWSRADSSRMDWALNTVGSEDWDSASVVGPYLILLVQCWLCAGWWPESPELGTTLLGALKGQVQNGFPNMPETSLQKPQTRQLTWLSAILKVSSGTPSSEHQGFDYLQLVVFCTSLISLSAHGLTSVFHWVLHCNLSTFVLPNTNFKNALSRHFQTLPFNNNTDNLPNWHY